MKSNGRRCWGRWSRWVKQAGEKESRDEDDEDEDGGVVCEVGMGVEGEAEGSVVELEKIMKEKTDLTQEEEIKKMKG